MPVTDGYDSGDWNGEEETGGHDAGYQLTPYRSCERITRERCQGGDLLFGLWLPARFGVHECLCASTRVYP